MDPALCAHVCAHVTLAFSLCAAAFVSRCPVADVTALRFFATFARCARFCASRRACNLHALRLASPCEVSLLRAGAHDTQCVFPSVATDPNKLAVSTAGAPRESFHASASRFLALLRANNYVHHACFFFV
jgi:hypothetical protein